MINAFGLGAQQSSRLTVGGVKARPMPQEAVRFHLSGPIGSSTVLSSNPASSLLRRAACMSAASEGGEHARLLSFALDGRFESACLGPSHFESFCLYRVAFEGKTIYSHVLREPVGHSPEEPLHSPIFGLNWLQLVASFFSQRHPGDRGWPWACAGPPGCSGPKFASNLQQILKQAYDQSPTTKFEK